MRILSIETSCDETAIAIIETTDEHSGTITILADNTLSQINIHRQFGGVFPMVAKREHARVLVPLLIKTLEGCGLYKETSRHVIESPLRAEFQEILDREPELFAQFISKVPHIDPPAIDAIAVTVGPGLEPALWVGINFAKALSLIWKTPVIAVDHMKGHLLAPLYTREGNTLTLAPTEFPAIGLLVSGGHTELILMTGWGEYRVIGETKDDAVGEAFDKVARMLSLPYPGGPEIARLAEKGQPGVYPLPRPMLHSQDLDFSFAGLKTSVLYLLKKIGPIDDTVKADIAREFEDVCVEVLVTKTLRAVREYEANMVILGGGVSANRRLQQVLVDQLHNENPALTVHIPGSALSTDNALMIAIAGYRDQKRTASSELRAEGHKRISE